jgi:hypothetical protein
MKWNWGTKLFIATAAFMIMVIIFGIIMAGQDLDLVEKDYYPKAQLHQELIDKRSNAHEFAHQITAKSENGMVMIKFPDWFIPDSIEGQVHFYHRISDRYDLFTDLSLDTNQVFSRPVGIMHGRYILKIDWTYRGEAFYVEKSLEIY